MRTLTNLNRRIIRLVFTPEGTTLVAAVRGAMQLGLWELPGGKFRRWHPWADRPVSNLAYSPDGKWLAVSSEAGLILPYLRARDNYNSEMYTARTVAGLAFSSRVVPGRNVLAIGGDRVRFYDLDAPPGVKTGLWSEELPSLEGSFRSLAFHPKADVLVACDTDRRTLHVWGPGDWKQHRAVARKSGPTAVTFSANGDRVLVAYGGHAQLLDPATWSTLVFCPHARGRITDLAASPCGRWFATAGTDGIVRLWHNPSGAPGPVFDWRLGSMTAVAFAPDGFTCAAGGQNGKVVVWDLDA